MFLLQNQNLTFSDYPKLAPITMEANPVRLELPDRSLPVPVSVDQDALDELRMSWKPEFDNATFIQILLKFPAFKDWLETLEGELRLQSMDDHLS